MVGGRKTLKAQQNAKPLPNQRRSLSLRSCKCVFTRPRPKADVDVAGYRERARGAARAREVLQVSLSLAKADFRQAPNFPPPRSTFAHCCRMEAPHFLSAPPRASANLASLTKHGSETSLMCSLMQSRSLPCPGGIPGHSFSRSATQDPPSANFSCAVAFDDHNIKMAPIIKMIFITEGPPTRAIKYLGKSLSASRRFENHLNQTGDTAVARYCSADCLVLAHSVISLRCGIWSLSGHSGHRANHSNQAQFMSTRPSKVSPANGTARFV